MSTRSRVVVAMSFVSIAAFVGGCRRSSASEDIDAQESADSVEANASHAQDSHFMQIFAANVTSTDPGAAADANGPSNLPALYPASCIERTKVSATVAKVTLTDCTGPFGLVHVSGDLIATFSASGGGALHVTVASENLTANGRPVTESGAGDITVSGTTRTVAWQGAWTRENALGETVAHTSDVTIAIDSATQCATADGTAKTSVAAREIDAKITGYKICKLTDGGNGCPWGSIDFTRVPSGKTLGVDFDGSAEARVTGPRGGSIEVPLVCEAE